jgi:hypothetical protein
MAFPSSPTNGQTAVVNGITYVYASATRSWARVTQSIVVPYITSTTAPTGPRVGDQWYNTSLDILYEYQNVGTGTFWVDISGPSLPGPNPVSTNPDSLSPFLLMGA